MHSQSIETEKHAGENILLNDEIEDLKNHMQALSLENEKHINEHEILKKENENLKN